MGETFARSIQLTHAFRTVARKHLEAAARDRLTRRKRVRRARLYRFFTLLSNRVINIVKIPQQKAQKIHASEPPYEALSTSQKLVINFSRHDTVSV